MKLAIAGKGGVGKTTLAGTLARLFAKDRYKVIAIDADPAMNLASTLGIPKKITSEIVPLSENDSLIEERTGARPGFSGNVFSLTPNVHDIAEKYGVLGPDSTKLIIIGTVKSGGVGCMCPANALLKAFLRHILIAKEDIVIIDMEAGLEPLGRGTVRRVDFIISVVEPRMQSIETTNRILKLAYDIKVKEVLAIGNKVRNEEEKKFLYEMLNQLKIPLIGIIPYDDAIAKSDMLRIAPIDFDSSSPAITAINNIKENLIKKYA